MVLPDPRATLAALIRDSGEDCASLSRLIGRNPAYVHQYLHRGSPRRLAEADRAQLARYFGVPETWLGAPEAAAPPPAPLRILPRLDLAASAGPGAVAEEERALAGFGVSEAWLRRNGLRGDPGSLSLIEVRGESMRPTLAPGDEILVDRGDAADRLRDGLYVVRLSGALHVKRLVRAGAAFRLLSDNPEADPLLFDDPAEVTIIGRVRWAGRRFE
ncbi:S24 family peptidase [Sphingomonas morindae]|uniref:S24 family peptidase n=1 Tax=Sphingomonas morindae TaxID=1541170 RepID=A0ABY4X8Y3_9SPHN|nr:S24 family peptidase [Sphingomonas morindae]USI73374.1 S24 family peptidase [Sphingomonas morindae]